MMIDIEAWSDMLLYCLSGQPPPLPSWAPFTSFPKRRMKKLILISTFALAVIATAETLKEFLMLIKKKTAERRSTRCEVHSIRGWKKEIAVGENITVLIKVRSCEDKVISHGRKVMTIERSGYESFLSLSNSTIQMLTFLRKYARTRQIHVSLTAAGSVAKEAGYLVKAWF